METATYALPLWQEELDRLDIFHKFFQVARAGISSRFHGLHQRPLALPHHILDLGCGTGIWTVDMAQYLEHCPEAPSWMDAYTLFFSSSSLYPSARLVGLDLNYTQPPSYVFGSKGSRNDSVKLISLKDSAQC